MLLFLRAYRTRGNRRYGSRHGRCVMWWRWVKSETVLMLMLMMNGNEELSSRVWGSWNQCMDQKWCATCICGGQG